MKYLFHLLILFSGTAFAMNSPIAQIDLDRSLAQMHDYKDVEKSINKFVVQKNKRLDYEYTLLENIKKQYINKKDSKTLDKMHTQEKFYQSQSLLFQNQINDYAESQKGPLLRKLIKFSQEYAIKNNIDFLLDTNKSILYEKNTVKDLTDEILRAYNANKNK